MATKKTKVEVKNTTIDFSNSIEKIKATTKTVNAEVVDTTFEIIEDLRTNGTQLRVAAIEKINEAIENATVENGVKFVKETAQSINEYNIETAEEIIEATVETGKEWQAILAKSLKGGVALLEKQQDITLTALEGLKKQYQTGNFRFKELFKFNFDFAGTDAATEKIVKKATAKTKAVKATAKTAAKTVKKAATKAKATKTTAKTAVKATAKTAKAVKATATKTAKKAVAKVTKPAAKKTTAKKTTAPKKAVATTSITRNKLTTIEGIGPKIEALLQKGGIFSFQQLADASQDTLKGILAAAGARYKMHDPTTWNQQAALAAAGKREELAKLQAELKGGKVAKK